MATEEYYDIDTDNDDLDEDIERLNIILQDSEDEREAESDGELQSLEQNDDFTTSLASRPSTGSDITASSLPTTSMGTEVEDIGFRIDSGTISSDSCLAMNRAYQEVLLDVLRQIELSLGENRKRQKELEEELDEKSSKSGRSRTDTSNSYLANISVPYFKDKHGNNPPFNEDVKLKEQLNEEKQEVKPKAPWTKRMRNRMLKAVSMDSLEKQVRPLLNKLEVEMTKLQACKNSDEISECTERIDQLQDTIQKKQKTPLNELLEIVDTDKIDFMKISVVEFDGKYDAFECELMWRNVLHPQINRNKWTKAEEDTLNELVEKHECRNWDKIAAELETNRTPFQCLQHYQQKRLPYEISEWTLEEDEFLKEVVDACKYGKGKIHWNQVSYYITGRTADMCEKRWVRINPQVKKGRWTDAEDVQLLAAVKMFGVNDWLRIAEHIPTRSANQCRERWNSCLTPNIVFRPWTYEEDKELMQLNKEHGNLWTKISKLMPGRSDNMCSQRHGKLIRWKASSDEFYRQPLCVQKELIHSHFEVQSEHKGIKLRPVILKKKKCNKRSLKHGYGKCGCDDEYTPEDDQAQMDTMGKHWEFFAQKNSIQIADYEKQLADTINGDMVVPRPPPLKRYSVRSFAKTWERRRQLQSLVEMQIFTTIQQVQNEQNADTSTVLSHVSETLTPYLMATDEQKRELIAGVMQGRQPHELTVREMLDISRAIATSGPQQSINLRLRPANKRKLGAVDWSSDEEEEDEMDDDEMFGKPRKESIERTKNRMEKIENHKMIEDQLKDIVASKLGVDIRNGRFKAGRRKAYAMYPYSSFNKSRYDDPADEKKMGRKSMALMMKTLDMDPEATYSMAIKSQRRIAAMALMQSASMPIRTRRHTAMKRHINEADTKLNEDCEEVISLRRELGIKNTLDPLVEVKEEPLSEGEGEGHEQTTSVALSSVAEPVLETSGESRDRVAVAKDEAYDKQLPFIPPNVKNLHGIRTLTREHRCLVDSAQGYFDRDDLKRRLYEIKNAGRLNPFLQVLGNMGRFQQPSWRKAVPIDQKPEKTSLVLQAVKKTKAFKQLQARFQAIFSWPALMSTIKLPKDNTPMPASPCKPKPEAVPEAASDTVPASETASADSVPGAGTPSKTLDSNNAVTTGGDNTAADTAGTSTEEESENLENLTEEEAIEKLVQKIMKEYKETRNPKRLQKRHRKKSSELVRNATYTRERIKILRNLGLLEKMQGFERQRLEKQQMEEQAKNKRPGETSGPGKTDTVVSVPSAGPGKTDTVVSVPSAGPGKTDTVVSVPSAGPGKTDTVVSVPSAGPGKTDTVVSVPSAGPGKTDTVVSVPSAAVSASSTTVSRATSATIVASSTVSSSVGVQASPTAGCSTDFPLSSASTPPYSGTPCSPVSAHSSASTSLVSSPYSTMTPTVKREPGTSDTPTQSAARRLGRPKGSKSNAALLNSQDRSAARKSGRNVKMPVVLTDYKSKELLNEPPTKRKSKKVEVSKKRLKEMIPGKLNEMIPFLPDLPILSEPQPCPKPKSSQESNKKKRGYTSIPSQESNKKKRGRLSKVNKTETPETHEIIDRFEDEEISSTGIEKKGNSQINEGGSVLPSINSFMSRKGNSHIVSEQNISNQTSTSPNSFSDNNFEMNLEVDADNSEDKTPTAAASNTDTGSRTHADNGANEGPDNTDRVDSIAGPSMVVPAVGTTRKGPGKRKDHGYCRKEKSTNVPTVIRSKDVLSRLRNKVISAADASINAAVCSGREGQGVVDEASSVNDQDHAAALSLVTLGQKKSTKHEVALDSDGKYSHGSPAVPNLSIYVMDKMGNITAHPERSEFIRAEHDNATQGHLGINPEGSVRSQPSEVDSEYAMNVPDHVNDTISPSENDTALTISDDPIHASNHANALISAKDESLSNSKDSSGPIDLRDDGSDVLDLSMKKVDTDISPAQGSQDIAPVILPSSLFPGGDTASMFVAVPVMMGDVKQMACMPVVRNQDGEYTLPFEDSSATSTLAGFMNVLGATPPSSSPSMPSAPTSDSAAASMK